MSRGIALLGSALTVALSQIASPATPEWNAVKDETLRHFTELVRMDTSDPPGNEKPAAEYLKKTLEQEGIAVETFALEPNRPNVVARLKGNGTKRPLLLMGHTDVVNVDPKKWVHPPFSATREGDYIYGRGTVDDKDNVVAGLMTMLLLKRGRVPLDRDVILLAEAGEEGSTRVGIQFMVKEHFETIDAEYCLAEGGSTSRVGGRNKFTGVQTLEKIPRGIELTARGISGHGSVPLRTNAIVHLSAAVTKIGDWKPPLRLNDTTSAYFNRLAGISTPEDAARYRSVVGSDRAAASAADDYFLNHEPRHASMLRTSVSPNIIRGGYRINVIPSEASATLDVRMHPDDDPERFLGEVRKVIDDPAIEVRYTQRDVRPNTRSMPLDSEAFKAIETVAKKYYGTVTLPIMATGATDMAFLRAKGVQCYGVGPAIDVEDGPKGFGAHSDQERILEAELHRFVRFQYDIATAIAGR